VSPLPISTLVHILASGVSYFISTKKKRKKKKKETPNIFSKCLALIDSPFDPIHVRHGNFFQDVVSVS
jgi:hypothetical protein